jgi:hypothetical protein
MSLASSECILIQVSMGVSIEMGHREPAVSAFHAARESM